MSVTKERQETFYAKRHIKPLLDGYAKDNLQSKSAVVNAALEAKFATMSQAERQRLIQLSKQR